jgi:hypothetical protein
MVCDNKEWKHAEIVFASLRIGTITEIAGMAGFV